MGDELAASLILPALQIRTGHCFSWAGTRRTCWPSQDDTHGLTEEEGEDLRVMRLNNSRWKEKEIDGEARRKDGQCPLTPGETALFLRALGFPNTSVIYIAAGTSSAPLA